MTAKGGMPYRVERRTKRKRGGGQLSGCAMDITIRVNGEEAYAIRSFRRERSEPEALSTYLDREGTAIWVPGSDHYL